MNSQLVLCSNVNSCLNVENETVMSEKSRSSFTAVIAIIR